MATDNSEPRIGRIVFVGVFVVAALLCVRAGLVAYFDIVSHAEELRRISAARPEARLSIQAEESLQLCSGRLPMDHAMKELAAKGRLGVSLDIQPQGSRDTAPLMGWMQMPSTAPVRMAQELDASAEPARDGGVLVDGARYYDSSVTGKAPSDGKSPIHAARAVP